MATVRIGDRDLDVKHACLGFLKKLIPIRKAMETAPEEEQPDQVARLIWAYVGHNDGVTVDWLLDVLPMDPVDELRACRIASGQKVKETVPVGEAARP